MKTAYKFSKIPSIDLRVFFYESYTMKQRRAIVEHPFGTIKRMMNNGRFLCRGLNQVKCEMTLSVIAYNFLRTLNILGTATLRFEQSG